MALRASFTLVAALYIGSGNSKLSGDLPLRVLIFPEQAVAHPNHLFFRLRQTVPVCLIEYLHILSDDDRLQHFPVSGFQNIKQTHRLPVFIRTDRVIDGDFPGELFPRPEHHQDLICYPPPNAFLMH